MIDPIADFLARIRNAQMARHSVLEVPYSRVKHEIADVMKKSNFLKDVVKDTTGKFPVLKITLPERTLTLTRVSKCGQRIYVKSNEIQKVLNGLGIAIVSTSQGVMTGYEARDKKIGGELMCEVF